MNTKCKEMYAKVKYVFFLSEPQELMTCLPLHPLILLYLPSYPLQCTNSD